MQFSSVINRIEEKGYFIPEDVMGYTVTYDRANAIDLKNAAGEVVETLTGTGEFIFTVTLPKACTIETASNDNVTIDETAKVAPGSAHTVHFTVNEGCAISSVIIDGEKLSKEEIAALNGAYTFENVQGDHQIRVDAEPVSSISFHAGYGGELVVDGETKRDISYEELMNGTTITVPETKPMTGYEFKGWKKGSANGEAVELGAAVMATGEDQVYYAVFQAKTITLTFVVKEPGSATLTKAQGRGTKAEQIDESTVKVTYTYPTSTIPGSIQIKYPSVKVAAGYEKIGSGKYASYWTTPDGNRTPDTGTMTGYIPTEDGTYTLIAAPSTIMNWEVDFVDADGTRIDYTTGKNNLNETKTVLSYQSVITRIENKGYFIPEEIKEYTLTYEKANAMEMKNAEGEVVQEGVLQTTGSRKMIFTVELPKVYEITTTGENVTISESGKAPAGSDYTVTFAANEGYGISSVTVDDVVLSKEEIQALNGSYTFADLSANHTIAVAATHEPKLEAALNITSTPGADGVYKLGETITYTVTVTNTGNIPLKNIVAESVLSRADGMSVAPDGQAEGLEVLAVGETRTFTYSHVVTAEDLGNTLICKATVSGSAEPVPDSEAEALSVSVEAAAVATEDPYNCAVNVTLNLVEAVADTPYVVENAEFYVALFADAEMTQRVSDVKALSFNRENSSAAVTFDGLQKGSYYVAETNAAGAVVTNGILDGVEYQVYYGENGSQKVDLTENGQVAAFTFANAFLNMGAAKYDNAELMITKLVKKSNGKALKSDEIFYFGLFKDAAYTQPTDSGDSMVAIDMNGKSSASTTVEVYMAEGEETTLYVTEVNADGRPVTQDTDFAYTMTGAGAVTLNLTDRRTAELTLTNTQKEEEEIETEKPTEKETEKKDDPKKDDKKHDKKDDKKDDKKKEAVKTGDNTPIMLYVVLLVFAAVLMAGIPVLSRRRRRQ